MYQAADERRDRGVLYPSSATSCWTSFTGNVRQIEKLGDGRDRSNFTVASEKRTHKVWPFFNKERVVIDGRTGAL